MYNIVHLYFSILKELHLITEESARALSKEFSTKILPSTAEEAHRQSKEAFKKVEEQIGDIVRAEPWLQEIKDLELRVKDLEDKLAKKTAKK